MSLASRLELRQREAKPIFLEVGQLIAMPHAYTEDQLVEQPATGLFAELGWTTVSALEEMTAIKNWFIVWYRTTSKGCCESSRRCLLRAPCCWAGLQSSRFSLK